MYSEGLANADTPSLQPTRLCLKLLVFTAEASAKRLGKLESHYSPPRNNANKADKL